MEAFVVVVLGAIVGSFLNVAALRLNTGKSLSGRSSCYSCKKALRWYELIPLLSYLLQRGRCRSCGSKFSIQYPSVELLTAVIFLLLHFRLYTGTVSWSYAFEFLLVAVIFCLLIVILVYDIRHKIIPNNLVYLSGILALLSHSINYTDLSLHIPDPLTLLAGPALAFPLFLLWLLSRGAWIGLGDAKLMLTVGWLLELEKGFSALLIAFWLGAAVSVLLLWASKVTALSVGSTQLFRSGGALTMKSEVPFAPFIIVALWITYFLNLDILTLWVS